MEFQEIIVSINNAFFRLESYMSGTVNEYKYFGFNDTFTILFIEAKKSENFTYENCKLIGEYWKLTEQIRVDYDQSDFDNTDAYENEMFCKDCEEIMFLNWERIEDFAPFSTPDEIAESEQKHSITNILKIKALPPQQLETKSDKLKAELGKYGFFELAAVKLLSEPNKQNLIELISSNDLPYSIAMFEYLGFLKHLEKEHFQTKYKLNEEVSKWFNSDNEGRAVKGNISSLLKNTTENKARYTAYKHKETVKENYQKLK